MHPSIAERTGARLPAMTKDKLGWMTMFLLSKPHGVRFSEIQEQWRKNNVFNNDKELQYRTFYNWCQSLKEMGKYYVECDKKENLYHLRQFDQEEQQDRIDFRLIGYSLTDYDKIRRAMDNQMILDRIVKEETFDAEETLDLLSTAMRQNNVVRICYEKFGEEGYEMEVHPYALRLCQRRWYLLAYSPERKAMRTYAIDRLPCCTIMNKKFKMPKDFSAEEYFEHCVGVFLGKDEKERKPQLTLLKTTHTQSEYLQTLPLHKSQNLVVEEKEYSIFSYYLLPTDELATRILMMGDQVEVLQPLMLRDKVKTKVAKLMEIYNHENAPTDIPAAALIDNKR